ncbi:hypothetical protein ECDEC6E_1066 [Escherichia coli DEC6E]|nr:hypothetical protein ECDEC6E_1066 [Escherichia coli DEC6E]
MDWHTQSSQMVTAFFLKINAMPVRNENLALHSDNDLFIYYNE